MHTPDRSARYDRYSRHAVLLLPPLLLLRVALAASLAGAHAHASARELS